MKNYSIFLEISLKCGLKHKFFIYASLLKICLRLSSWIIKYLLYVQYVMQLQHQQFWFFFITWKFVQSTDHLRYFTLKAKWEESNSSGFYWKRCTYRLNKILQKSFYQRSPVEWDVHYFVIESISNHSFYHVVLGSWIIKWTICTRTLTVWWSVDRFTGYWLRNRL